MILGQFIISIIFLIMGFSFYKYKIGMDNINRVLSCYILYFGGSYLNLSKHHFSTIKSNISILCLLFVISFTILIYFSSIGSVSLGYNQYKDPFFLIIASISGTYFVWFIASFIEKSSFLRRIFISLGTNSLYIMIFHLLSFKLITILIVYFRQLDKYTIAVFPCFEENYLWILYTVIGSMVSLAIGILIQFLKRNLIFVFKKII